LLRETLRKAANGESLTEGEAERALETIMEGSAPPAATPPKTPEGCATLWSERVSGPHELSST
jgi:hypothetical protein